MLFQLHNAASILAVIYILLSFTFATPNVGIRADWIRNPNAANDKDIQSYSSIIKFNDGTIPLDKTKMTDAKFLNLCVVAYNEMVNIWGGRNLASAALPGAMAAVAYKDSIYFGSSIRAQAANIALAQVAHGSVREIMDEALTMGLGKFFGFDSYSPTLFAEPKATTSTLSFKEIPRFLS